MVVSGCPDPKEDPEPGYYAAEIAKFSLELISKVKQQMENTEADSEGFNLMSFLMSHHNSCS